MLAAGIVLAVSTLAQGQAATPASAAQAPQARSTWPHNEGRMFATPSREAWALVQARLKELGIGVAKIDTDNQLLITKWAGFGDRRFEWLPRPAPGGQYEAQRVRFEVFVSPFVEPARVYVGSLTEMRLARGRASEALLYNDRGLNRALLGDLARALGGEGFEIPSSRGERDELSASILGRPVDDCAQRIKSCTGSSVQVQDPRKLELSQFDVQYPKAAVESRTQAPVVIELQVLEDGAVVDGRLKSAPRGHQLDAAAAGATSLLVYSPVRLCGCPADLVMTVTVNYRIAHR
jgi:hypothetical protein